MKTETLTERKQGELYAAQNKIDMRVLNELAEQAKEAIKSAEQ